MKIEVANSLKILNALIYSIRPSATLGSCLLTLAAFNPQASETSKAVFLTVSMFFASSYCFLINDIYDRKKDLLNDKKRPIATGVVPINIAIGTAVAFSLIMIITSWFVGIQAFFISLLFLIGVTLYSYINAKTGLFANAIVALTVAGTQWGVWFIKPDDFLLVTSIFLFFFSVPREMLLDWLDIPGDRKYGKPSFPMNHSVNTVKALIAVCLMICTGLVSIIQIGNLSSLFFILSAITLWISFFPFFRGANNASALLSVRLSHATFAFLILALFSR